jgi:Kdo2-lipid IVA lauroyltransferase/acyltransferase
MNKTAPPLHWLVANAKRRGPAWSYWVVDPLVGLYNAILHYAMRLLPIDSCSNLGAFLSFYDPFFFRESDTRARKAWINLRSEESDPASVDAAMRRLWRCISRTMAEYSVIDRLWDAGRISVEGMEHLYAARAADRPLLIAALHLGNWEVAMIPGTMLGFAGSGIYQPQENRFNTRLAVNTRNRYNVGQVSAGGFGPGAMLTALGALQKKRGGPFVIFVDEIVRGRVNAPAFGRPLQTKGNIGLVARLAARTNAAVIPVYCVRVDDSANFIVHVLPPIELLQTANHKADVINNVDRINAVIEPIVRKYLDQWYFLLDFEFDS